MNDWNQNGKNDAEDKAVFHEEISPNKSLKKTETSQTKENEHSFLADLIINGICALILFFIFGAENEINSFTAIISLICLVKIGWSLFVLFINATSR